MYAIKSIIKWCFMRNSQAGYGPKRRVSNSPANPLPPAFYSAAGRLGQIVSKLMIGIVFSALTGALRALKRVFPLPAGTCRRADQPSPDPAAMLVEFNWGSVIIIYPCLRATQTYLEDETFKLNSRSRQIDN
jgi:hypothetical protein